MAVLVRYDIVELSGRRYHWNFGREGLSGRTGRFLPGTSYLVTPSGKVEALLAKRSPDAAAIEAEVAEAVRGMQFLRSVAISVDSVVYEDGLFVGPDRSNTYRTFDEWLRAQGDLYRELDVVASSGTDADLEKLLTSKREKPAASFADRDFYGRRQEFLGRVLLQTLKNRGRDAFGKELDLLKVQDSHFLHRKQ